MASTYEEMTGLKVPVEDWLMDVWRGHAVEPIGGSASEGTSVGPVAKKKRLNRKQRERARKDALERSVGKEES